MKVLFIIGHPTQFEGPFYQYVQNAEPGLLHVLFVDTRNFAHVFDPEIQRPVDFGLDLRTGYEYDVLPAKGRRAFIRNMIQKYNYDLIVVNGYKKWAYFWAITYSAIQGKNIAIRLDTVEFMQPEITRRVYRKLLYLIFNRIFCHFFVTGILSRQFLERQCINASRVSVFSYVIDNEYFSRKMQAATGSLDALRKEKGLFPGQPLILAVCKLHPREVPWDLIHAMREISEYIADSCLMIVGDGSERNTIESYCQVNHLDMVKFVGYIPYTELPMYYAIADVFVHAVANEPWGVSVQEALACGLPVVTSSKVGAAYDLIEQGTNGFIYPLGNTRALARAVIDTIRLLDKDGVRKYNCEILSQWSYASTLRNLIRVVEDVNHTRAA